MQKVDTRAAQQRAPRMRKAGVAELRKTASRAHARAAGPAPATTQRRLAALRALASVDASRPLQQAAADAARTLTLNPRDVPFALIYVPSADRRHARLAAWAGSLPKIPDAEVPLEGNAAAWPFERVSRLDDGDRVDWPQARERSASRRRSSPRAAVFALGPKAEPPAAYLVLGINPHRRLDDDYRDFLELAAIRVGSILDEAQPQVLPQSPGEEQEQRNEFLAMLAHELRNPLAPIRNATELLKYVDDSPASLGRAREIIERQLNQLVRLMDDLLDASRVSRGKLDLIRKPMDLRAAISDAVETSSPAVEEAGHRLTVRLPDEPLDVDGDAARLCQVLSNLLSNAAQYSQYGGRIELSAQRRDGKVVVRLKDDGIGISADMLPRIFDLFVQADQGPRRPRHGLGIGLTIARRLVELHGGQLTASSAGLGRGSEFVVELPSLEHAPAAQRALASPEPGTPGRRILVADDNSDAAAAIAEVLRAFGHDVRTAGDGAEAVDTARHFRPELILLDIGMPKLDGIEACRRIRRFSWGRKVSICAVTGWGQASDRRRTREAGFTAHLVKPVAIDAITRLIE
ncbi:MAG: hybrid sensor histidine kinase/response regulator, partial [Gammaproteobacteria bacterium]|nr:hybrid sensor histidine kinase/response regulator [Gammaproteobacteria bacterium]